MPLYANQSQTLVDYENTQLVSQDGSIMNYDVNDDDAYKEASSPDYENYDCLIVADDEPSDQIESPSDFEAGHLTAVTLPNGCQAFVNVNADELNLDQDSDGEVQLDDEQALLVNNCSQQLDGQQIQLGDGRIAILHATTERTEGFQAVELEDGTTAFIALSDLMGEPLDPSSFVICENIVSESDIDMDRTAELEDFEVEEIESKDFPLTQPDDRDEYQSDNESTPNHAYIDVASFNENVNFDESIDEETIVRVHTQTETDEDGVKTEEPSFSDSQNYQALELDNGTICFAVKNDEQKSDSESNDLQGQAGDDYRINVFGVRERTKSITCPEEGCGKCYTTLHHLKVHQRAHTGDRPFPCTIDGCTKAFSTGYGRKAHVRTHTGEKPYKCPEGSCEKSFKTSGDLQKHIRTHTGERPFRCPKPECGRSFTTSNIRKVHFRTHTGERPYLCPETGCGRAFASATNYKNHTRIHSGEKPYICTIEGCSKRFTEYSSLYKHHMVHTQQKPYHCNLCDRHYRQPSTLTMHKRTAHGVVEADDGTEIIMGDTVFAFAEAAAANKRLKTLGANFLSYSKKGNKILTVQASGGGSPDAEGQQYLVLTNSMQIAALEHLGVSTSHSHMADDSEENEEEEDDDDELELEEECILSPI